jgi:CubicO group peptidase (beta-lactamase class C family)
MRFPMQMSCGLLLLVVAPIGSACTPAAAVDPVVKGELGAKLDSVARAAETAGFHGVVLVARTGEDVLYKGYGLANHETATRFGPLTVVQIGSAVKDFTKVAILQQVEAGKLKLSDPLARFFANAPADKRAITVQQLLEHRAGFPQAIGRDEDPLTKEQLLARLFARPLDFSPGSRRQYSNPGFSVLAVIVEQLTGQPFDAYLEKAIFRPLGLRDTGLLLPHFEARRLAHGYVQGKDRGTMFDKPHTDDGHNWNLRGNGGLLSTLRDMHRFYRAMRDATLLAGAAHRALVMNPRQPTLLAGSDGTCFFIFGNYPGANSEILVASNHAEWPAPKLVRELESALGIGRLGEGPGAPTGPATAKLPDTGPGRTVAAYLAAFNSGDADVMRHFLEEKAEATSGTPPMPERLDRYRQMFRNFGRLTLQSVKPTTAALEVTLRAEHGQAATFGFLIEPAAPFRLRAIRVQEVDD